MSDDDDSVETVVLAAVESILTTIGGLDEIIDDVAAAMYPLSAEDYYDDIQATGFRYKRALESNNRAFIVLSRRVAGRLLVLADEAEQLNVDDV